MWDILEEKGAIDDDLANKIKEVNDRLVESEISKQVDQNTIHLKYYLEKSSLDSERKEILKHTMN